MFSQPLFQDIRNAVKKKKTWSIFPRKCHFIQDTEKKISDTWEPLCIFKVINIVNACSCVYFTCVANVGSLVGNAV